MYSPIGRTRTLPKANDEDYKRVRIAHFSCSNFVSALGFHQHLLYAPHGRCALQHVLQALMTPGQLLESSVLGGAMNPASLALQPEGFFTAYG